MGCGYKGGGGGCWLGECRGGRRVLVRWGVAIKEGEEGAGEDGGA